MKTTNNLNKFAFSDRRRKTETHIPFSLKSNERVLDLSLVPKSKEVVLDDLIESVLFVRESAADNFSGTLVDPPSIRLGEELVGSFPISKPSSSPNVTKSCRAFYEVKS